MEWKVAAFPECQRPANSVITHKGVRDRTNHVRQGGGSRRQADARPKDIKAQGSEGLKVAGKVRQAARQRSNKDSPAS